MNSGSSGSPPHSHDAHQHGHDHGHDHGHHHGHGHGQSPAEGHGHAHSLQDLSVGLAVLGMLYSSSPTHGMFNLHIPDAWVSDSLFPTTSALLTICGFKTV